MRIITHNAARKAITLSFILRSSEGYFFPSHRGLRFMPLVVNVLEFVRSTSFAFVVLGVNIWVVGVVVCQRVGIIDMS